MTLLVVCGLKAEAEVVAGPGVRCVVGGGRADLLRARLEAALSDAVPDGILSFGVAGALAPGLRSGEVRVAEAVLHAGRTYETDPPWREALARRLEVDEALVAASDTVVTRRRDKAALREATGADLVDMESGLAAELAYARGVPFAALRAVSDQAGAALPPSAVTGMGADGEVRTAAVLRSALTRPQDWPGLVRAGGDAARAFRALREARAKLADAILPPA